MSRELIERLWSRGKEFLGVEYPVLGGAMTWISESKLVSAISNAGAFGVLAGGNMPPRLLKDEIKKTRDKTDKPFGINLITIAPNFSKHLEHVLKIEFPFVILAGGLGPSNIDKAIRTVRPYAVDVNSGVEERPGKKSYALVKSLMDRVRKSTGHKSGYLFKNDH